MQLRANVTIQGLGFVHAPGTVFDVDDAEGDRLLKLKAASRLPVAVAEAGGGDSGEEFLTDDEEQAIKAGLMRIEGMTDELADKLIEAGVQSLEALAQCKAKPLYKIVGKDHASDFIADAKELVAEDAE